MNRALFLIIFIFGSLGHAQMFLHWRQEDLRVEPLARPLPKKPCPDGGEPVPPPVVEDSRAIVEAARQLSVDYVFDNALECFPAYGKADFVTARVIPSMAERFRKNPPAAAVKANGEPVTHEDLMKIDLYARLLLGEMASTSECSDFEVKALGRLILNRVEHVENRRPGWTRFADQDASGPDWRKVLTKKWQFQALDGSSITVACPAKKIVQKLPDGTSSGSYAYTNTYRAVEIAMAMVLDTDRFRHETSEIDGFLYTKSRATERSWKEKGFQLITDQRVDGKPVNNVECIHLWRDPTMP